MPCPSFTNAKTLPSAELLVKLQIQVFILSSLQMSVSLSVRPHFPESNSTLCIRFVSVYVGKSGVSILLSILLREIVLRDSVWG